MMRSEQTRFSLLQERLVAHLRSRVRGGELTERSAARLTGISQPHLHNVLKGARLLSTDMADRVLGKLHLSICDLLGPDEVHSCYDRRTQRLGSVPVLGGRLGPGLPFPVSETGWERFPFPLPGFELLLDPALVELGGDPRMAPLFRAGDMALIERLPSGSGEAIQGIYYAIEVAGQGFLRCPAKRGGEKPEAAAETPGYPDFLSLADRNMLEMIRAKVVWIGRNLEPPDCCPKIA
jgi:hypothetical protein